MIQFVVHLVNQLVNTESTQIYTELPKKDSSNPLNPHDNPIRFGNVGPIAVIGAYELTTTSGRQSEDINNAHVICSRSKFVTTSKGGDVLSIDIHREIVDRARDLTNNKLDVIKAKF